MLYLSEAFLSQNQEKLTGSHLPSLSGTASPPEEDELMCASLLMLLPLLPLHQPRPGEVEKEMDGLFYFCCHCVHFHEFSES